jgi:MSHA biogenesis protein MshP
MALVAAMFLIVVLALLGVFAVRVGGAGEQDVTASLMESRALAAARSGIEYGAYRVSVNGCNSAVGVPFNFNLTQGALNGFNIAGSCRRDTHPSGYNTYVITVTASKGTYGRPDYVSRQLTRTVSNGVLPF